MVAVLIFDGMTVKTCSHKGPKIFFFSEGVGAGSHLQVVHDFFWLAIACARIFLKKFKHRT